MKRRIAFKKPAVKTSKTGEYENKLTSEDLKGKKVDAFPDNEEDKPLAQNKQNTFTQKKDDL